MLLDSLMWILFHTSLNTEQHLYSGPPGCFSLGVCVRRGTLGVVGRDCDLERAWRPSKKHSLIFLTNQMQ